ncbi:MAG TPA: hypothetical protein VGM53_30335 [Streptosporangiaceae bacterium]|jgi:hypothetical protein
MGATGGKPAVAGQASEFAVLRTGRRAARRLARIRGPKAAAALARAAAHAAAETGFDDRVPRIAHRALGKAKSQPEIDAICATWHNSRDPGLGELIGRHGWVAGGPPAMRARTALHGGHAGLLAAAGPELACALAVLADEEGGRLRAEAVSALATLDRTDARGALCALAVDGGSPAALDAALSAGFLPGDPARRAALLFLGGQFSRYAELDFAEALAGWNHRHDIEIGTTTGQEPEATDISLR